LDKRRTEHTFAGTAEDFGIAKARTMIVKETEARRADFILLRHLETACHVLLSFSHTISLMGTLQQILN
jgi:hypothetical protein